MAQLKPITPAMGPLTINEIREEHHGSTITIVGTVPNDDGGVSIKYVSGDWRPLRDFLRAWHERHRPVVWYNEAAAAFSFEPFDDFDDTEEEET